MQTSAITNPAVSTGNNAAAKSGTPPDTPFGQVLSREVANRNNMADTSKPIAKKEQSTTQSQQAASAAEGAGKAPAADEGKTAPAAETANAPVEEEKSPVVASGSDKEETTLDPASAELLALVANLRAGFTSQPAQDGNATEEDTQRIAATAGGKSGIDAAQLALASSSDTAETSALEASTSVLKEPIPVTPVPGASSLKTASTEKSLVQQEMPAEHAQAAAAAVNTAISDTKSRTDTRNNRSAVEASAQNVPGDGKNTIAQATEHEITSEAGTAKTPRPQQPEFVLPAQHAPEARTPATEAGMAPIVAAVNAATQPAQAQQTQANAAANHLSPYVGSSDWNQSLGQKVVWMVGDGQQSASLTLNPPDLGPLQVVLNVSNSHATANFTAAQPEVRQALENALPKLREMLGEAGIQLGQANVSAGTQHSQQGEYRQEQQASRSFGQSNDDSPAPVSIGRTQSVTTSGQGLVDTFV